MNNIGSISTRTLRVVVAILLLLGAGTIFALRSGGGGGGIDVFTEDLASAGIDPATVPEAGDLGERQAESPSGEEDSGSLGSATQDSPGLGQGSENAEASTIETVGDAPQDEVADDLSTQGATGTPGSTGLAAPTVSTDPGAAPAEATRSGTSISRAGTTTTTPSRYLPATSNPTASVAAPGSNSDRVTAPIDSGSIITDGSPVGPANPYIPVSTPSSPPPATSDATTPTNGPAQVPSSPATTNPNDQAATTTTTPTTNAAWCQIEVRASDGVIRWNDQGRTAVLRVNDAWFHTPDPEAQVVLIPDVVDTSDEYILRLWGNGTDDVECTYTGQTTETPAGANQDVIVAPAPTTAAPTTTTTTIPAAVAFTALPAPIGVPAGPPQFGFAAGLWGQDRTDYWNNLDAVPGTGRLIAHEFKSFTKEVNTDLYRWHMQSGRDLLLTWNGTDAEGVLNGSHDDWIRHHARELKSLPDTVMLRFWHEPDVSHKLAWIDNDPQQYIDSWMHVRRIFAEEQALNVEWVWCPTAWNWAERGSQFYPGDANVDWLCADGYSGWDLNAPLPDVENAFTSFQAWANQRPHKPILVAEFGAGERGPGDRAEWIAGIPDWVQASPNIRAVVYFDVDMRPNGEIYDWRIRTEPDAWEATIDVLTSAPFVR